MTAPRIHNFGAGPGVLPESVLREAQEAIWNFGGSGIGILECSHRGRLFEDVLDSAKARFKRLLNLGDDHEVMFLQGGARTQFFMVPMNLLQGGRATYLDTGVWAEAAAEEAQRFGTVDVPFSSKAEKWNRVPQDPRWVLPEGSRYLHYTTNNTVAGSEFHHVPEVEGGWLFADMSSNFLSRPVDGSKFDLIYGGAQKNLGPAGVTVVIMRKSLIERCNKDLPTMLRYDIHAKNNSLYNTPPTFGIWFVERVCAWIEDQGGLEVIHTRNQAQAARVYAAIDNNPFYRGKVEKSSRSLMNLTFETPSADLDERFAKEGDKRGLHGLKGHRIVGGLRASLYNAQNDVAVDALVEYLGDFARRNG